MARFAHNLVSAISNGADATLVRPSDWNADHDIILDARYKNPIEDDFIFNSTEIGELGWSTTATGTAANTAPSGEALHPGIFRLTTGAVSANNSRLHPGAAATSLVLIPINVDRWFWVVRIPTITTMIARVGLGTDVSAANMGTAGVWWEYDAALSANWRFYSRDTSTNEGPVDSTVAVVANSWYVLEARRDAATGNWTGYINHLQRAAMTVRRPAVAVAAGAMVQTSAASARSLDVDLFGLSLQQNLQRYT